MSDATVNQPIVSNECERKKVKEESFCVKLSYKILTFGREGESGYIGS